MPIENSGKMKLDEQIQMVEQGRDFGVFRRKCAKLKNIGPARLMRNQIRVLGFSLWDMSNDIGSPMTTAGEYRVKAEEFRAMAQREANAECQREYERLAQCYVRLANLAERNSLTDLVYETPSAGTLEDGNSKPSESAS